MAKYLTEREIMERGLPRMQQVETEESVKRRLFEKNKNSFSQKLKNMFYYMGNTVRSCDLSSYLKAVILVANIFFFLVNRNLYLARCDPNVDVFGKETLVNFANSLVQ
jgi:hypothetical protein